MREEEIELLREFWSQEAWENIRWVRENPTQATRLIWYLIGYSHLAEKFEKGVAKRNLEEKDGKVFCLP